jgi:glutathione S-transferase
MPKLLCAPASPYSAKVRMAAAIAGIEIEVVKTDTGPQPEALTGVNPLGKIPCLVLDNGHGVYDSRVITQHLNRMGGGVLFPRNAAKRLEAEQLEALADGICDCLLAHVYERRFRPAEKVQQSWLDLQWSKVVRALDVLNAAPPRFGKKPTAGHVALRACLGYLALRFAGQWEKGRSKLVRWTKRFDDRFPQVVPLLPA